jgi:hypothetical protein
MWLAPKDLQAPVAQAGKVAQVARAVDANGLEEEAVAVVEAAERSLVAAVVELGAEQEVAREAEANSGAEAAADFFASK